MKTPQELACAISALINSKPRSPTIAELEGVIAEHWQIAPGRTAIPMTGVAASLNPPMVAVVERMRGPDLGWFGAGGVIRDDGSPLAYNSKWFKPEGVAA